MIFKKKQSDDPILDNDDSEDNFDIIKPKIWKLLNWLIFCAFILILSSYLNAKIFLLALGLVGLIILSIKLYLINKLPPINFRIYIFIFFIIFIVCEYNHLQIVYFKSFKISNIDSHDLLTNPGIFIEAICNIVFTTKIQIASNLFFSEDFIQWFASYLHTTLSKALIKIDGIFFGIFGYIVPVLINLIYSILTGVLVVRIKQLLTRS